MRISLLELADPDELKGQYVQWVRRPQSDRRLPARRVLRPRSRLRHLVRVSLPAAEGYARRCRLPKPGPWTGRRQDGPPTQWLEQRDAGLERWIEEAEHDPDVHADLLREALLQSRRGGVPDRLFEWAVWNVTPPVRPKGRPNETRDRNGAIVAVVRMLRDQFGLTASRSEVDELRYSACDVVAHALGLAWSTVNTIWKLRHTAVGR